MRRNEKVALIGPSGCGKSTFLNILAGLNRPTSGTVNLLGTDILGLSASAMDRFRARNIGYIHQNFNLIPGFTALENVLLAMQFGNTHPKKDRKEKAKSLLAMVGLEHRMGHKPEQLSNGEQQRVAIARALSNKPALVLADEPTASLDPENTELVMSLLLQACDENQAALLLVSHDMSIAEKMERTVALSRAAIRVGQEDKTYVPA
ncbi:ABC transporter ATP-binding protein [Paenibacillus puerhi]|uniref:ABC transporter ATP-binding protein n=1 Tax=Paenibacillus puerhi TaxID=2692622 RepID=UPI001F331754|nr:ABC transporter ATP-binding protein [Paenibacillus puerhi]